jgi:hypothetical protein
MQEGTMKIILQAKPSHLFLYVGHDC